MSTLVAIALIAALVVTVSGAILGIGPRLREISWALEDSVLWLIDRTPLALLFWGGYLALFASVGALLWLVVA